MNRLSRNRRRLRLIGLMALIACSFACRSGDKSWQRVQQAGVLRVGLDPTYPPFEELVGSDVVGLDVDLARALGQAIGVEVTFTYYGFDGLYDALRIGQVDVLASALTPDAQRTGDFDYNRPYFNAGQVALARRGEPSLSDLPRDLTGRTLAVELGTDGHVLATSWQRQVANLTVRPFNTPAEALEAVRGGQADAVVLDAIGGRLALRESSDLFLAADALTVEPFALVVRKEDGALLAQLNQALAQLAEGGELAALLNRWLWFESAEGQ